MRTWIIQVLLITLSVATPGAQQPSWRNIFTGDFNGDLRDDLLCYDLGNRDDLLCRSPGGIKWIDYADAGGRFDGTDWSLVSAWCTGPGDQVFLADWSGDGRADLMCEAADGRKWLDYADTAGRLNGTDAYRNTGWCGGPNALYPVRLAGDIRTDLLCSGGNSRWTAINDL